MIIEVPEWCKIGRVIEWKAYNLNSGSAEWYKEQIISYGCDGFFHRAHNCPVYYSKFFEYGNTVRECSS